MNTEAKDSTGTVRIGIFECRVDAHDALWNQCDAPSGRHRELSLCGPDPSADHIVCLGVPIPRKGGNAKPKRGILSNRSKYERYARCFRRIDRPTTDVSVLFYEPPPLVKDIEYEVAKDFAARVYGPDDRATDRITLPVMWRTPTRAPTLRALIPPDKNDGLVVVTSGKTQIQGHRDRLDFIRRLQRADVDVAVYGAGLPDDLRGYGFVRSKHEILQTHRLTLAIENAPEARGYVSEKLWDPLLAWSLPLYYGSNDARDLLPHESFIRLPDLQDAGLECVRQTLADSSAVLKRTHAMAQARSRILGPLRMVEWIRHDVLGVAT